MVSEQIISANPGLSQQEVLQRRGQGLGNDHTIKTGRTYWQIARANLFTLFNNILFVIALALISMGRVSDAFTSVGIGLVNALISTLQEIRAKQQLDQIALPNEVAPELHQGVVFLTLLRSLVHSG